MGFMAGARDTRSSRYREAFSPGPAAAARRMVPIRARAMPTEQMTRYFQVASRERWWRWKEISGAEARVVASMADPQKPRWWVAVTRVMEPRKKNRQAMNTVWGALEKRPLLEIAALVGFSLAR
jgi:hypothetical protein